MYSNRYIQYLDLAPIPDHVVASLDFDVDRHCRHDNAQRHGPYIWSDYQTSVLNEWCKQNISRDLYYGIQLMTADVPRHIDIGTKVKINYLIDCGGHQVITNFYDHDKITLLDSYQIDQGRWHIFKADTCHEIINIQSTRISVTAKIF